MNSRNSLKQWLTRRRVKDFFLAADGDNVGPRAQPVALLDKPNFRNIASVEANPTNTQAHLPRQEKQSKSALRLSRLSLCLCTLCLSLLLKITRGLSIPSSDHILHILCLIKFPLFFGVFGFLGVLPLFTCFCTPSFTLTRDIRSFSWCVVRPPSPLYPSVVTIFLIFFEYHSSHSPLQYKVNRTQPSRDQRD